MKQFLVVLALLVGASFTFPELFILLPILSIVVLGLAFEAWRAKE